jgi:hypothetical protein
MVGGIIPLLRAASFRFDGRLEQESAPAAIRPYSIAVAPDSSARNLRMIFMGFLRGPKT